MRGALGHTERACGASRIGFFARPPKYAVHRIFGGICKNPLDGIPVSVQPLRKLLSGAQKTLYATWSIACVVERGRKVIEVRPEWTPP